MFTQMHKRQYRIWTILSQVLLLTLKSEFSYFLGFKIVLLLKICWLLWQSLMRNYLSRTFKTWFCSMLIQSNRSFSSSIFSNLFYENLHLLQHRLKFWMKDYWTVQRRFLMNDKTWEMLRLWCLIKHYMGERYLSTSLILTWSNF